MKFLTLFILLCTIALNSFAKTESHEEAAFKKAEDRIITLLRMKDPTLDSRKIKFERGDSEGGFAVCCYTTKTIYVFNEAEIDEEGNSKSLGAYKVSVGNQNYKEYEKGILYTDISPVIQLPQVEPSIACADTAQKIATKVFNSAVKVVDPGKGNPVYFMPSYSFEVQLKGKRLGEVTLNAANCEMESISYSK